MSQMMNLNLLPSSAKFQASKIRLQKKIRLVSWCLLGGWVVTMVVVFTLNIVVKMQLESATASDKKANASYNSMTESIITSQDLKYKAKMVAGVLSKRFEYGKSFETVQNLFETGIELKKYALEGENLFKIEGMTTGSENVDKLEKMVVAINSGEREGLKKAEILNLSLTGEVWNFTMEVALK